MIAGVLKTGELKLQGTDGVDFRLKVEADELNIKRGNANLMTIGLDESDVLNGADIGSDKITINAPVTFKENVTFDHNPSVNIGHQQPPLDKFDFAQGQGPYAVDCFQLGKQGVQVKSPVPYRVDKVPDLEVNTPVQKVTVEGVEYFGRTEEDGSVTYLTYPLPMTLTCYVPSKRTNKDDKFPYFAPKEYNQSGFGNLSLDDVLGSSDHFNNGNQICYNLQDDVGENSLKYLVANLDLSEYEELKTVYFQGERAIISSKSLYEQLEELQTSFKRNSFLRIMSGPDTPPKYRLILWDLMKSSENYRLMSQYKTFVKDHANKAVADANKIFGTTYDLTNIIDTDDGIPMLIGSWHFATNIIHNLASWGIGTCLIEEMYTTLSYRTPGRNTDVRTLLGSDNLNRGLFPEFTGLSGTWTVPYDKLAGNYGVRGETEQNSPDGEPFGYIMTLPYDFDEGNSITGITSRDCAADWLEQGLDILHSNVGDKINYKNLASMTQSGSIGAYSSDALVSDKYTFKCGVCEDALMNSQYLEFDGFGKLHDRFVWGNDGFKFPVLLLEPLMDSYNESYDIYADMGWYRYVVGRRYAAQQVLRKTSVKVRNKCIYME